ncbi:MAG: BolA family transcriptional regulator [Halobacteriovoraceae bacterium]|jgi:stress-induced morphogen|nr:BolA family transcriptional regulator [Halobacteriovoraceae bacterium]MBT5093706.1 BolA family transcriptional regulator [Halobacteriovoraceae bacterium]
MQPEEVKTLIKGSLSDANVDIFTSDDNMNRHTHYHITVISDAFEGKKLLDQHRIIMDILNEALKVQIHAVKIKTYTHTRAKEQGINFDQNERLRND